MQSKYLAAFAALTADDMILIGDTLIVEEIKEDELKSKGGIIMATGTRGQLDGIEANKPQFVRIIAVGKGYYDEDTGEDVPLDVKPGDIVLIGKLSVQWFSAFGNLVTHDGQRLGLTRETEIKVKFKGQEGYDATFVALHAGLNK